MRLAVHVTEVHIRKGVRNSALNDPVGLALEDAFREVQPRLHYVSAGTRCSVATACIRLRDPFAAETVILPVEVFAWMRRYQKTGEGVPFAFTVEIPDAFCHADAV